MKQILLIHGGMTFSKKKDYINFLRTRNISLEKYKSWAREYLDKKLGKEYQIIRPRMPLQDNAQYEEWKIHFERYIPLIKNNIILIGSSLGSIFLARYLSENKFPKKISKIFLVCPPYDNSIPLEELTNGFKLKANLELLEKQSNELYLLFSKNDPVVPLSQADKYKKKLKGKNTRIIIYPHIKGHFEVEEFPEIIKLIKK
ncbi:alpha/beta hydrolase [Candidatus Woesearchaeota archaeon]|nr:alpha/beta hydrolase [Candidatus Woesearchaeota archaeon]MCF7901287.1 alpha/beta hydrolase [Candidatus Woesearchaeota archaeon]